MTSLLWAELGIEPRALVREILRASSITQPPTKGEDIAECLGLKILPFDHDEMHLSPKVLAFLWPSKRLIGVDKRLSPRRRNFSILHEIGHFVLPGHMAEWGDKPFTDGDKTLSTTSVSIKEMEANQFAADCLFQLDHFDFLAQTAELNWRNIQNAADTYEASFEATARRWVERSSLERALVVFKPESRTEVGKPLTIMYTITSPSFCETYFAKFVPGQQMPIDSLAYKVFYGLEYHEQPEELLRVQITAQRQQIFLMSLFSNSYRMFGLLRPAPSP
jgi:Zn-dependent peptidase ImmA (M78 family)